MSVSKEFRVTLETVTPLFLGGAEPRSDPELRPPSIRGAMRYWSRAIVGSITGDNLSALKDAEAGVFGSAGDKDSRGSHISIRKDNDKSLTLKTFTKFIEYRASDGETKNRNGLSYLWFAERKTTKEKERRGLQGEFDLAFSTQQLGADGTSTLLKAYGTLWLLTRLGGLGNRTHRGAGCVQVKLTIKVPDEIKKYAEQLPLPVESSSTDDLKKELENGIDFVRRIFSRNLPSGTIAKDAPFDILHPDVCEIYIAKKVFDKWETALDKLGDIFKKFRFERDPDYKMIKGVKGTSNNLREPVQRATFGLPIPLSDDMVLQSTSHDRRSSPLWFHIVKLAGEPAKYAIVIIWFKSKFLPDNAQDSPNPEKLVLVEKDKNEHLGNLPNHDLIDMFLKRTDPQKSSSLKDKGWGFIEVEL